MTSTLDAPAIARPRLTAMPTVLDARVVTGSGGGPDKTILNSPRFLEPLGYRMLCGYLTPPGDPGYADIEAKAKKYATPLVTISDRGPWDWRIVRHLLRVCRDEKVAIWHGHDYKTNALGLLLCKFHRMKLVTTVHGWVQQTARTPLYYRIDKWCLPRYERVICVSDDLFAECRKLGIAEEKYLLVENAIDADEYRRSYSASAAKAKLGLPADAKLIGAVGRLSEEKAFDVLIRAVAPLIQNDPSIQLMIVGEGSERPQLEALVRELRLTERVKLPGWRSDVRDIYEAMDLFALSSRREGLPNVLLEAMALEVPVAATNVNGIPRLIRDGVEGRLVSPDDAAALRAALAELLSDRAKCAAFRAAGRHRVEEHFSFPARMAKLAAIYDDLLGGAA
jgi:glycosyltransferase involved in cell wall biosynthesis